MKKKCILYGNCQAIIYVYELLNAVPDYFIIVLGISLVLTILISFLSAIYVMFNKKSNSQ